MARRQFFKGWLPSSKKYSGNLLNHVFEYCSQSEVDVDETSLKASIKSVIFNINKRKILLSENSSLFDKPNFTFITSRTAVNPHLSQHPGRSGKK